MNKKNNSNKLSIRKSTLNEMIASTMKEMIDEGLISFSPSDVPDNNGDPSEGDSDDNLKREYEEKHSKLGYPTASYDTYVQFLRNLLRGASYDQVRNYVLGGTNEVTPDRELELRILNHVAGQSSLSESFIRESFTRALLETRQSIPTGKHLNEQGLRSIIRSTLSEAFGK